jgi:hypothetical protein
LVTVLVIVIAALGLLGLGGYSEGMLQLFALPHGMLASRWNWHWSSMTMLKSLSRKVEGRVLSVD